MWRRRGSCSSWQPVGNLCRLIDTFALSISLNVHGSKFGISYADGADVRSGERKPEFSIMARDDNYVVRPTHPKRTFYSIVLNCRPKVLATRTETDAELCGLAREREPTYALRLAWQQSPSFKGSPIVVALGRTGPGEGVDTGIPRAEPPAL